MLSAENPMKVTQALIDAEVTECPALAPYYAAAQRLGKIVIIDEDNKVKNVNRS